MLAGPHTVKSIGAALRQHWLGMAAWLVAAFLVIVLLLDHRVSTAFAQWPEAERSFFHWITEFGESAWVLVPALVLWLVGLIGWALTRAYWWRWSLRAVSALSMFTFAAVGIPGLAAAILKRVFGRARPVWLDTEGVFAFRFFEPFRWDFQSFPSGHATTSLAFALAMVILFGRKAWWVFIPAVLIALSRVVIQMHFLSDIVFGGLLGMTGAWLVAIYWRDHGWVFAPAEPSRKSAAGWANRMWPIIGRQVKKLTRRRPGNG